MQYNKHSHTFSFLYEGRRGFSCVPFILMMRVNCDEHLSKINSLLAERIAGLFRRHHNLPSPPKWAHNWSNCSSTPTSHYPCIPCKRSLQEKIWEHGWENTEIRALLQTALVFSDTWWAICSSVRVPRLYSASVFTDSESVVCCGEIIVKGLGSR